MFPDTLTVIALGATRGSVAWRALDAGDAAALARRPEEGARWRATLLP
jgi:hypothetical protein